VGHTVILALGRLRQEDLEFEASLGNIVRLCLKKQTSKQTKLHDNIPMNNDTKITNKVLTD
jgi:hypothetical protein